MSWYRIKPSDDGCKRVKAFAESGFNVSKLSVILTCAAHFQGKKIKNIAVDKAVFILLSTF